MVAFVDEGTRLRYAVVIPAAICSLALAGGAAHAGPTGHWTQITKTHNGALANLGLARSKDGTLHVFWAGPAHRRYTAILDTPIAPSGTVGAAHPVVSGWYSVNAPDAVTTGAAIHVVISGQKVYANDDPNAGLNEVVGPGTWKLGGHAFGSSPITVASNADVRVTTSKSGQLVTVWRSAASMLFQTGVDPTATPTNISTGPKDPAASPVIATDPASGDVVIAYHGVGSGKDFFRRILPTLGPPEAMPGSKVDSPTLGARPGGGVFSAYTPDGKRVWLLRFGGKAVPVPVPAGVQVLTAGLAGGPDGRIWLFYGNEKQTYATRTNKAVSRFESVQTLSSPPGAVQYFRLEGEGSAGPLDLFADVTVDGQTKDGSYYEQVQPELSVEVSKKPVKNQQGAVTGITLTVRVTDAGDAVGGAGVAGLPGGAKTTAGNGTVTVTVPPTGSIAVTAKKPGYIGASTTVSL